MEDFGTFQPAMFSSSRVGEAFVDRNSGSSKGRLRADGGWQSFKSSMIRWVSSTYVKHCTPVHNHWCWGQADELLLYPCTVLSRYVYNVAQATILSSLLHRAHREHPRAHRLCLVRSHYRTGIHLQPQAWRAYRHSSRSTFTGIGYGQVCFCCA